tara:strand:+ start:818 stop:1195 length:378 start_codon:yes stop_codon:yes gene_type:complete
MDLSGQKANNNYKLSAGSGSRKDVLNYSHEDYNNYHSWSNVNRGNITLSSIDENNQVNKNNFPYHRIQPLAAPFMSFGDTSLCWAPANSNLAKPLDDFMSKSQNNNNNQNVNNGNNKNNKNNKKN